MSEEDKSYDNVTPAEARRLAHYVTYLRRARGMTREELAERIFVETWQLKIIEDGALTNVSEPAILRAIAFALKVSPVDLDRRLGRDWRLYRTL